MRKFPKPTKTAISKATLAEYRRIVEDASTPKNALNWVRRDGVLTHDEPLDCPEEWLGPMGLTIFKETVKGLPSQFHEFAKKDNTLPWSRHNITPKVKEEFIPAVLDRLKRALETCESNQAVAEAMTKGNVPVLYDYGWTAHTVYRALLDKRLFPAKRVPKDLFGGSIY